MEKRIIGIDFGTSTSVVRVKNYNVEGESWKSLDRDITATRSITFNNGAVMVPTLVQKLKDGSAYFGYDAAMNKKGAVVYQNFKVELKGENSENAKELTQEFIRYLCKHYQAQRDGGYMGDVNAEEKTVISYPVKWDQETRDFMINAAKNAGFKNVEGMDEAQAAIIAVTALSRDMLEKKQYITAGNPVNIMLIDMGAGTTDIVICRYIHGETSTNEVLCTWPTEGDILFGGREMDGILKNYITEKVPEEYRAMFSNWINDMEYKVWKEANVSDSLAKNESITTFDSGEFILEKLNAEMEPFTLDRNEFESYTKEYLAKFAELVNGSIEHCIREDKLKSGNDIDLVIITGGHSQWYFVREMLLGKAIGVEEDKAISLARIKADPGRIISIAKPQETVALGLVYSKLPLVMNTQLGKSHDTAVYSPSQQQSVIGAAVVSGALVTPEPVDLNEDWMLVPTDPEEYFEGEVPDIFVPFDVLHNGLSEGPECFIRQMPPQSGAAWDQLQSIISEYYARETRGFGTASNNLPKLRFTLGIPTEANLYYYSDTSMFQRGAGGVGVYKEGLSSAGMLASRRLISWFEYMVKSVTPFPSYGITESLVEKIKSSAYYNGIKRVIEGAYLNSVKFRQDLREAFLREFGEPEGIIPYHMGIPRTENNRIYYYYCGERSEFCICDAGVYSSERTEVNGIANVRYVQNSLIHITAAMLHMDEPQGKAILEKSISLIERQNHYTSLPLKNYSTDMQWSFNKGKGLYISAVERQKGKGTGNNDGEKQQALVQ